MAVGVRLDLPQWFDQIRFGGYQIRTVLLCFLVTTFDGFDTQAIAFTGPALAQALGFGTRGLLGALVSASCSTPMRDR